MAKLTKIIATKEHGCYEVGDVVARLRSLGAAEKFAAVHNAAYRELGGCCKVVHTTKQRRAFLLSQDVIKAIKKHSELSKITSSRFVEILVYAHEYDCDMIAKKIMEKNECQTQ